ncbi:MAG TPA: hypothetical protein VMV97_02865 [Sulfuriferula sp.]|nr:hypothetical protein [Sulfuriferula sp.]
MKRAICVIVWFMNTLPNLKSLPKTWRWPKNEYSLMLLDTFNRLRRDAIARMGHKAESLPEALALPRPWRAG